MSKATLGVLGLFIFIGVVLTFVSVFTNAWVVDSASAVGVKASLGFGLVPYQSELPTWFHIICFEMYTALGLTVLLIFAYIFAFWKASQDGCCHGIRHAFLTVSAFASPIAILEICSFFIALINAPVSESYGYGSVSQYVGYSGYLAVVSGFVMSMASGLATYIARRECH